MARILLYETCQERASGLYRQVQWFYNDVTRAVETDNNAGATSCQAFSLNNTVPVASWCEGTTKKTVYHNGGGTVIIKDTVNSPDCGYTAPGGNPIPVGCDVVITQALTSPSRKGQTNGSVTINITGSGNIEYSTDGVNFSSGSLKTGLAPGSYIAYARRANEIACVSSMPFTVAELPGISVEVSSGCEGGLGFIDLKVTSPETEGFIIDLVNQTTQEVIHEEIENSGSSYSYLYTNLTNGDWIAKVSGTNNTLLVLSPVQSLRCSPGTGNGEGGKRISEMEELDELNDQVYFPVIDLTETDKSKQNKKIHRSKLPAGGTGGGTTVIGGLRKKGIPYVTGTATYTFPFPVTGDNFESADVFGPTGEAWDLEVAAIIDDDITFANPPAAGNGTLRFWYTDTEGDGGTENPGGGLTNINGLIQKGENIEITGAGTAANPYVISAVVPDNPGGETANIQHIDFYFTKANLVNNVLTLPSEAVSVFAARFTDGGNQYNLDAKPANAATLTPYDFTINYPSNTITFDADTVAAFTSGGRGYIGYYGGLTITDPTGNVYTLNYTA